MREKLVEGARRAVEEVNVIVMSDYLKGVLTAAVAVEVKAAAQAKGKPVVANPKPRSLPFYAGADLVSLNRAEASEALGHHAGLSDSAAQGGASQIRRDHGLAAVLVTLGESGMVACNSSSVIHVEAPKVEVYDTAGAGDTVIATVALGLAAAGFQQEVFELAAQTAASVVRHVGVATPSPGDLEAIRSLE